MNDGVPEHWLAGSLEDPVDDLLDVLALEPVQAPGPPKGADTAVRDRFTGRSQPQPHGRVFGGQVLAQCIVAAGRTVADLPDAAAHPRRIHSLHGYFLRPGDSARPLEFAAERLRDGGSFSARRVHALQDGVPILSMITSFQTESPGMEHQDSMPAAPEPETLASVADLLRGVDHPVARFWTHRRAIDLRHVEGGLYVAPGRQPAARQAVWLRAMKTIPDDPLLHAAVLAYASDYAILEPVMRRHGLAWSDSRLRVASLDHAMWFHRPARADEWTLYTQSSPSASGGRGLSAGRMFAADGRLVASVGQEGMVRIKE